MSAPIRFDSLLVRELARELHAALRGERVRGVRFERDALRVTLALKARRGGPRMLVMELAADAGRIRLSDATPPAGNVALARGARLDAVTTPPDERILVLRLAGAVDARIVVELMTNQWNALVLGPDGRIVRSLRPRGGERPFRPGLTYVPPPRSARRGADAPLSEAAWRALFDGVPADERRRIYTAEVAFASPLNAAFVLGAADAGSGDELAAGYRRYQTLVAEPAQPALLHGRGAAQPYPHPLDDPAAVRCPTLLDAFERAAADAGPATRADPAELVARARHQARRLRKRAERLGAELRGAADEADRLRADADLLLAQLHRVERGAAAIELDDFTGGTRSVELDPLLAPAENAERMYTAARKRARAAEQIPLLVRRATDDAEALEAWATAFERGDADAGEPPLRLATPAPAKKGQATAPLLPYRSYTTSGGLEVRVGRSGRGNDELTARHAAPNDVWLHARDVAGAHVVLRWGDAEANPPHRDLAEAAVLAALHSRARTSGVVAVDWTRRKYVRKPRKARPGLVTLERAKTIFVEPDSSVLERMGRA